VSETNLVPGAPLMIPQLFSSKIRRLLDGRARSECERVVRLWRGDGRWGVL
jgi:hypothetical protein